MNHQLYPWVPQGMAIPEKLQEARPAKRCPSNLEGTSDIFLGEILLYGKVSSMVNHRLYQVYQVRMANCFLMDVVKWVSPSEVELLNLADFVCWNAWNGWPNGSSGKFFWSLSLLTRRVMAVAMIMVFSQPATRMTGAFHSHGATKKKIDVYSLHDFVEEQSFKFVVINQTNALLTYWS